MHELTNQYVLNIHINSHESCHKITDTTIAEDQWILMPINENRALWSDRNYERSIITECFMQRNSEMLREKIRGGSSWWKRWIQLSKVHMNNTESTGKCRHPMNNINTAIANDDSIIQRFLATMHPRYFEHRGADQKQYYTVDGYSKMFSIAVFCCWCNTSA